MGYTNYYHENSSSAPALNFFFLFSVRLYAQKQQQYVIVVYRDVALVTGQNTQLLRFEKLLWHLDVCTFPYV